jgi:hypothetical protein
MVTNGMARWHFLELVNFIATELHKGFGPQPLALRLDAA